MKNVTKTLMVCLVVTFALVIVRSAAIAQVGFGRPPLWDFPSFSSQPLQVPTWEDPFAGEGDILVDNFEYWDSPYNHGWRQSEPAYPVYGFGMGYATIFNTVLDLQQGSRVLDVYRPPSIFLIGTPYEKHAILYSLYTPPSAVDKDGEAGIDMSTHGVISFQFRAPLGIEYFDMFELAVIGEGGDEDNTVTVRLVPIQPPAGACLGPVTTTQGMYAITSTVTGYNAAGQLQVTVSIGRGMLDGSWHVVWLDLADAVKSAVDVFDDVDDPNDWYLARANAILVSGQMFRMDNLIFRADYGPQKVFQPDLFEMGPLYAQIFEPYRYLFMADYAGEEAIVVAQDVFGSETKCARLTDLLLNLDNFLLVEDPNDPNDPVVKYWTDLGADPNLFGENDPNLAKNVFDREQFVVDLSLPIFADPNLRMAASGPGAKAKCIINAGTLGWNPTINGYGPNGIQAFLLQPLSVYPYDGMPTYIPAFYNAIEVAKKLGKAHFGPQLVYLLEGALWNAGITVWPNIAALDYTPLYFEDLIVTIEVTNGAHSDVRTFPISVVNYPVENYPPVVQLNIMANVFTIGQMGEHMISFIDPDSFIFSMSSPVPATTHMPGIPISANFRTDMDTLYFNATINGLTSYQYGPWIETIINPSSGLLSWVPKFEGANHIVVNCTDSRGAMGLGDTWIIAVSTGTWLNHPPYVALYPEQPIVVKAGEEVILHSPQFIVVDADGDELYASCNIGSCGRGPDGNFIWQFQSNFPGSYLVEIVFYDIRGGYAVVEMFVDVKPWWSY